MVLAPGIGKVFEDGLIQIILQREFAPMSHARAWLIGAGREARGERRGWGRRFAREGCLGVSLPFGCGRRERSLISDIGFLQEPSSAFDTDSDPDFVLMGQWRMALRAACPP
jgi:hypothetical protein